MAKYIDADLLRKEIDRLKDEYTDIAIDSKRGWVNANSVIDDLEQLQSQIDSLQQKQPEKPIPNDLEEAADEMAIIAFPEKKFYSTVIDRVVDYNAADRKNYRDGIIAGAKWNMEQMMKSAVEGYVNYYEDSGGILMAEAQVGCPYHNGDKVRVIVLPKED